MQKNKLSIAIQGIEGSFSEEAAYHYGEQNNLNIDHLIYSVNSDNVLNALTNGEADLGICAIENSTGGMVLETVYALAKYRCHIEDIFSIKIQQNLLTKTAIELSTITGIHSHRQALRQCQTYLNTNLPNATLIEASDTALAAQQLHQGTLAATAAVIGNKRCAELYQLTLLASAINDEQDNETRFIAVSKP